MRENYESPNIPDAGRMENVIGKTPISEDIKRWMRIIERTRSPFTNFYVACPEDKLGIVVDYIRKEIQVDEQNIVEVDAASDQRDICLQLVALESSIRETRGDRVLILVKGFEGAIKRMKDQEALLTINRMGHDWDQDIAESEELAVLYKNMGKKIIIITHIGHVLGEEIYELAVRSAMGSQFKNGIIEIR